MDSGGPPVLYDDVRGFFRLETVNRELIAYGLNEYGERLDKAPVTRVQGGFDVKLGGFAHYELILS